MATAEVCVDFWICGLMWKYNNIQQKQKLDFVTVDTDTA